MACNSLLGISYADDCLPNAGGITRLLMTDESNITGETASLSAWTVTALSSTIPFIEVGFGRNVGNTSSELAGDLNNRSTAYNNTINITLTRREATKSKAINGYAEGRRYLRILIEDRNGLWWNYPYMQLNTDVETSGTLTLDGSKYELSFLGEDTHKSYEVDSSIIAGLL